MRRGPRRLLLSGEVSEARREMVGEKTNVNLVRMPMATARVDLGFSADMATAMSSGTVLASTASSSAKTEEAITSRVSSAPSRSALVLARMVRMRSTTVMTAGEISARRVGLMLGKRVRRSSSARAWIEGSARSSSQRIDSEKDWVDMRCTAAWTP